MISTGLNLILHFYEAILCKYYSKTAFYHKMIDTYSGEPLVFMGEGLFLYLE